MDNFISHWLGRRVDYDKVYLYQCVDLILQYLSEVFGVHSGVWGNAIDYWTDPTPKLLEYFDKVSGTNFQRGDIIVLLPTKTNKYGHIMVAVDSVTALEQNGATGDGDGLGGDEVRFRAVPKDRIAGILRPKEQIVKADLRTARILAETEHGYLSAGSGANDEVVKRDFAVELTNSELQRIYDHPNAVTFRQYRNQLITFYNFWKDKVGVLPDSDDEEIKQAMAKLAEAQAVLQKGLDD